MLVPNKIKKTSFFFFMCQNLGLAVGTAGMWCGGDWGHDSIWRNHNNHFVCVFSFYLCGSQVESAIQEKEPCVGLGSECGSARIEISRGICCGSD